MKSLILAALGVLMIAVPTLAGDCKPVSPPSVDLSCPQGDPMYALRVTSGSEQTNFDWSYVTPKGKRIHVIATVEPGQRALFRFRHVKPSSIMTVKADGVRLLRLRAVPEGLYGWNGWDSCR